MKFELNNEDLKKIDVDLSIALDTEAITDSMMTAKVCKAYIDLVELIKGNEIIVPNSMDNIDRPDKHNVAGKMNSPSEQQKRAFKKESDES